MNRRPILALAAASATSATSATSAAALCLRRDVEKVLAEPDIAQRYATFGCEAFPATKEQFNAFIAAESVRFANVIGTSKLSISHGRTST